MVDGEIILSINQQQRDVQMITCKSIAQDLFDRGVELEDTFSDDNILSAKVKINDQSTTLDYVGWRGAAALTYMNESEKAKSDAIKLIQFKISTIAGTLVDAKACIESGEISSLDEFEQGLENEMHVFMLDTCVDADLRKLSGELFY